MPNLSKTATVKRPQEKIRPIDKKLQYQIEKLLKAAAATAGAAGGTGDAADGGGEAAAALGGGDDALTFGPRPDALVSKRGGAAAAAAAGGEEEGGAAGGVYRPPRLNPVSMELDEQAGELSARERRQLVQAQRRAQRSGFVQVGGCGTCGREGEGLVVCVWSESCWWCAGLRRAGLLIWGHQGARLPDPSSLLHIAPAFARRTPAPAADSLTSPHPTTPPQPSPIHPPQTGAGSRAGRRARGAAHGGGGAGHGGSAARAAAPGGARGRGGGALCESLLSVATGLLLGLFIEQKVAGTAREDEEEELFVSAWGVEYA